jgi:hypothetical protein
MSELSPNLTAILDRVTDPSRNLLDQALDVARRLAGLLDGIDTATNADAKPGEEVYVGTLDADELVELLNALDDCLRRDGGHR